MSADDQNHASDLEDPARTYAFVASIVKEMLELAGYTGVTVTPTAVPKILIARLLRYARQGHGMKLMRMRKMLAAEACHLECRSDQGAFNVLECGRIIAYDLAGSGVRPSQLPGRAGDDDLNVLWAAALDRRELEMLRNLLQAAKGP